MESETHKELGGWRTIVKHASDFNFCPAVIGVIPASGSSDRSLKSLLVVQRPFVVLRLHVGTNRLDRLVMIRFLILKQTKVVALSRAIETGSGSAKPSL